MGGPHQPTAQCEDVHCYSHHVDEPTDKVYIACGECYHVYRTAGELRRAYRRASWQISKTEPLLKRLRRILTIRVRDIYFCQHCIHDF